MRLHVGARSLSLACAVALSACSDPATPDDQGTIPMALDFCAADVPPFFAVQNDGGTWKRVTPDANGTFSFTTTPRFAFAFVRQQASAFTTRVIYATTAEFQAVNGKACRERTGSKSVNVSVVSVPTGNNASVTMGGAAGSASGPGITSVDYVPEGAVDLVAIRADASTAVPNRVVVRRGLTVANGGTITPAIDFSAAEAAAPATSSVAITGIGSGEISFVGVRFHTGLSSAVETNAFVYVAFGFPDGAQTIYGIPSATTAELHEIVASSGSGTASRIVTSFQKTLTSQSVNLGVALNTPVYSVAATTPYLRYRVQLAGQTDYASHADFSFGQRLSPTEVRSWSIAMTAAYAGGASPSWDVQIPDLSAVAGYPGGGLQTGVTGTASAGASSMRPALLFGAAPTDGESFRTAYRSTSLQAAISSR